MAIEMIGGRKRGFPRCDVRIFPVVTLDPAQQKADPTEATGYVTACSLQCAKEHAAEIDHKLTIESENEAEDEDDMGSCDRCGYPDPTAFREDD